MYKQIKKLADDALALQNKDRMDTALREISLRCDHADTQDFGVGLTTIMQPNSDAETAEMRESVELQVLLDIAAKDERKTASKIWGEKIADAGILCDSTSESERDPELARQAHADVAAIQARAKKGGAK